MFAVAKYEDAGYHDFICIGWLLSIGLSVGVSIIHVILFIKSEILLEGHAYGAPDRYGDYARGLYASEVNSLNGMIPEMWRIMVVLIAIPVINHMIKKKRNLPDFEREKLSLSLVYTISIVCAIFCLVGSLWESFRYSMYD